MKLPVHSQLVAASSLCAGGYLPVGILIAEADGIVGVLCLSKDGIIVIRYLCHCIRALIDDMADLVSDSPAKITSALIPAVCICLNRHRTANQPYGIPFNANVKAACIHKRSVKHSLITDV